MLRDLAHHQWARCSCDFREKEFRNKWKQKIEPSLADAPADMSPLPDPVIPAEMVAAGSPAPVGRKRPCPQSLWTHCLTRMNLGELFSIKSGERGRLLFSGSGMSRPGHGLGCLRGCLWSPLQDVCTNFSVPVSLARSHDDRFFMSSLLFHLLAHNQLGSFQRVNISPCSESPLWTLWSPASIRIAEALHTQLLLLSCDFVTAEIVICHVQQTLVNAQAESQKEGIRSCVWPAHPPTCVRIKAITFLYNVYKLYTK